MAARFPQSGASVAYQIKAAYAGKIAAIYWAAGADSVHRLLAGETASVIVTRSASGAGFNSGEGRITGNFNSPFSDFITGGLGDEAGNLTYIVSYYGDLFYGVSATWLIGASAPMDIFDARMAIKADTPYAASFIRPGSSLGTNSLGGNNDVSGWMVAGLRHAPADPTARYRVWANGAEVVGLRSTSAPATTVVVGDSTNPLRFGGTANNATGGAERTEMEGECWIVGLGLSDAEMDAITADPSIVIEAASGADTTPPVITSVSGTGGAGSSSGSFTSDEVGTAYWKLTATSTPETVPAYPGAMTGWTSMAMSAGSNPIASLTTTPGTYWLQVAAQDDEATPNRVSAPTVSASSFTVTAPPDPPVITDQPDNATVKAGQTAGFTVAATGSGTVTYQWQINTGSGWGNVSNGGAYSGATTVTLSVVTTRAMNGHQFRCNVSDSDAGPVASSAATLTVQQCVIDFAAATRFLGAAVGSEVTDGFAREVSIAYDVQVYPGTQWPLTAPVAGASGSSTNSTGFLAALGDDDLLFGTVYWVVGKRASDSEPFITRMAAS